jgi:putative OPT family oligopeptide transporter
MTQKRKSKAHKAQSLSLKNQLTVRGMIIGGLGAVILTTSSMYVALKLGALPWPIIFVALVSMFSLKALGNTNINEINVTHTAMSAGAMVAGGVAFTIPGLYMLDPGTETDMTTLFLVVLGGVLMGLISTGIIHHHFIVEKDLPYPMGQAAADTLVIGDEGGKKSRTLFSAFGVSALFTFMRDKLLWIPSTLPVSSGLINAGVAAFVWLSPMLLAVGYIIGPLYIFVWFLGAIIGDIGVVVGGVSAGWWDLSTASAIKTSLGIGVMVGCGVGIVVKGILPAAGEMIKNMMKRSSGSAMNIRIVPFVLAACALLFTLGVGMSPLTGVLTIVGVWLACSMSAQVVGQSGINPMEVFGVIVLLLIQLVARLPQSQAFFVAAAVAVGCGLAGDIMNDFKAGHILKTDPKAQWTAECLGGLIGAFVSVGVFFVVLKAYGPEAFGPDKMFPAPQASMVAAMVGGIPHMTSFIMGCVSGLVLYVMNLPVMTLGLGIYLPFYLSLTAMIGGLLKYLTDRFAPKFTQSGLGDIIAPGLLGGEAVIGVILALYQAFSGIASIG